ncbi:MAG TPA: bifunctional phosphoglucose/phosphomannose isomerase [bacterium]|nr:bifunctional phosphoglucose/phosphomannose isomerase [bacterium]
MAFQIENFPDMLLLALDLSRQHSIPSYYLKAKKIVLCGMGGSGIAGDVMQSLLSESSNIVVESIHGYLLPGYVDKDTLVVANSFSGNTEETLASFGSAYDCGAKLIAITTGGKLKALAERYKVPVLSFSFEGHPRASFPLNFVMLASVFEKLGYVDLSVLGEIAKTLKVQTKQYLPNVSVLGNPAKNLAEKIVGKVPVIYASEKLYPAALRFKAQINENAKSFAFCEPLPELNHDAIAGYQFPKLPIQVVAFESSFEQERIQLRHTITEMILRDHKISYEKVYFSQVRDRLEEMLLAIMFGDFVSYYLAILHGVRPADNKTIDFLKEKLH